MTLRLRDTLTRSVLPVEPLEAGRVRMYSCGPTVYRYAHVGNLRTFLLADLIRRALLYHGLEVLHVQNITDVGHLREDAAGRQVDPMLVAAGLEGRSSAEIANGYEAAFHGDAALLNLLPAHAFPRATEHIADMLALAEQLEDLGHAYLSPVGNLYYDVSTYPAYGALSRNTLDELRGGHRHDVEQDKRDPADFALWKAAGPGSTRELRWPSRWGDGFPGWHLECSAMALRHLGPTFDIHTGGEDNVFPHHEDEIAQSAPVVGGVPARAWVHGAHLLMSGRKMSKSAGNFQRITELAEEGVDPLAFRALCLSARYARQLNFSDESLAGAAAGLESLRADLAALGPGPTAGPWAAPAALRAGRSPDRPAGRALGIAGHGTPPDVAARAAPDAAAPDAAPKAAELVEAEARSAEGPALSDRAHAPAAPLSVEGRRLHDAFAAAIDDDLDTATALRIARATLRADLPAEERRWLVLDMDFVLGLDLDLGAGEAPRTRVRTGDEELPGGARSLLDARTAARAGRDWASADRLRAELRDLGIEPIDRADGTTDWRRLT
jgi:cysteinyl-tRNA synthetase